MGNENKFTEKFETEDFADIIKLMKQLPLEELSENFNDNFEKRLGTVRERVLSRKLSFSSRAFQLIEEMLFTPSRRIMFAGATSMLAIIIIFICYKTVFKSPVEIQDKQVAKVETKADTGSQVQAKKDNSTLNKSKEQIIDYKYLTSLTEKVNANMNYGFMNTLTAQQVEKIVLSKKFKDLIINTNTTITDTVKLVIKLAKNK